MKVVQGLEDSNLLLKRIPKAIESDTKEHIFRNVSRCFRRFFVKKYNNRHRNIKHWL